MTSPDLDKPALATIRRRLLAWFARHQRQLPWRSEPTPYRVWISEIMLQQTQVATALPYFERFVRRFPDVRSLAAADLQDVLAAWAGLGYYSRARNLHRAARIICDEKAGRFPDTLAGLLELPGVGRYTAGAILSIAFNQPAPILDGNVMRVLCRLFAIAGDPKTPANQQRLWGLAQQLVAPRRPSQFNQAMMELGALVCTPRSPTCLLCPLNGQCHAFAMGQPEAFPHRGRKSPVRAERWAVAVVQSANGVLMTQRAESGRWGGLWEFPGLVVAGETSATKVLANLLGKQHGLKGLAFTRLGQVRHQLSHRDMTVEVFAAKCPTGKKASDGQWVAVESLADRPVSRLTRKIAEFLGPTPPEE